MFLFAFSVSSSLNKMSQSVRETTQMILLLCFGNGSSISCCYTLVLTLTLTPPSNVDVFIKLFSPRRSATFIPSSLFHRPGRLPRSSVSIACKRWAWALRTIWTNSSLSKVRFHEGGHSRLGKLCKSLNSHFDNMWWQCVVMMNGQP